MLLKKAKLFSVRDNLYEMINNLENKCVNFEEIIKKQKLNQDFKNFIKKNLIEINEELLKIDIKYKSQYCCLIMMIIIVSILLLKNLVKNIYKN